MAHLKRGKFSAFSSPTATSLSHYIRITRYWWSAERRGGWQGWEGGREKWARVYVETP